MKFFHICFFFLLSITLKAQINLDSGLVAYFPFTGNTLDSSGFGNHATNFGATPTQDRNGVPNQAYNFDGVNDYMEITSYTNMSPTQSVSIATWVYVNSEPNPSRSYIYDRIESNDGYSMSIEPTGEVRMNINGGLGASISPQVVVDTSWHCLVGTYDRSQVKIFIDGSLANSVNYNSQITFTPEPRNRISGPGAGIYEYFHGEIDELRIYNRALTEIEIEEYCRVIPIPIFDTLEINHCYGDTLFQQPLFSDTLYVSDTIFGSSGFDSLVSFTSILVSSPVDQNSININLCEGESFAGQQFFENASLSDTLFDDFGCDSLILNTQINIVDSEFCDTLNCTLQSEFMLDTFDCLNKEVRLSVASNIINGFSYAWYFNGKLVGLDESLDVVLQNSENEIGLLVSDLSQNCSDRKDSSFVFTFCEEIENIPSVEIPNIITPNGDKVNDVFKISGGDRGSKFNVTIYNRWGKKVLQEENYKNDWEPTSLSDGAYFYKINVGGLEYKGWLQIVK